MAKQPDFQYAGEEIPRLKKGSAEYRQVQRAMLLALEQQGMLTWEERECCMKQLERHKGRRV